MLAEHGVRHRVRDRRHAVTTARARLALRLGEHQVVVTRDRREAARVPAQNRMAAVVEFAVGNGRQDLLRRLGQALVPQGVPPAHSGRYRLRPTSGSPTIREQPVLAHLAQRVHGPWWFGVIRPCHGGSGASRIRKCRFWPGDLETTRGYAQGDCNRHVLDSACVYRGCAGQVRLPLPFPKVGVLSPLLQQLELYFQAITRRVSARGAEGTGCRHQHRNKHYANLAAAHRVDFLAQRTPTETRFQSPRRRSA